MIAVPVSDNCSPLHLDILAVAFAKYVQADQSDKVNPFLCDNFQSFSSFHSSAGLTVGATNNRLKPKSNPERASSVLKSK